LCCFAGKTDLLTQRIRAIVTDGRHIIARSRYALYWYDKDLNLLDKWQPASFLSCIKASPYFSYTVACLTESALILKEERPQVLLYLDKTHYGFDCSIDPYEYLLHDFESLSLYDSRTSKPTLLLNTSIKDCVSLEDTYEIGILCDTTLDIYDLRFIPTPVLQYDHMSAENPPTYFYRSGDRSLFGVVRKAPANIIGDYDRRIPP